MLKSVFRPARYQDQCRSPARATLDQEPARNRGPGKRFQFSYCRSQRGQGGRHVDDTRLRCASRCARFHLVQRSGHGPPRFRVRRKRPDKRVAELQIFRANKNGEGCLRGVRLHLAEIFPDKLKVFVNAVCQRRDGRCVFLLHRLVLRYEKAGALRGEALQQTLTLVSLQLFQINTGRKHVSDVGGPQYRRQKLPVPVERVNVNVMFGRD